MAFESLEDVYLKNCAGKPVVPLQRHTIVERYKIVLKDEDQVSVDQEISPEMYDKIRREISRTSLVEIEGQKYTVNQVIDMILRLDAWDKGNAEYTEKFFTPIANIFNHVDINPGGFASLYKLQTDRENNFRRELIQHPGTPISLYSIIPTEFKSVFKDLTDCKKVFDMLYDVNPSIANVSVGRGEVVLTFISDAIKGEKGDLEIPGVGEVEIKGDGARLGGDGHAVDRSIPAINSILQLVGSSLSNIELNRLKRDLYDSLEEMLQNVSQSSRSKTKPATLRYFANKIKNDFTVDELISDIQLMSGDLGKGIVTQLLQQLNNIKVAQAPDRVHTLTDAVRLFFSAADQMTYEKFIDGVVSLRSYYMNDKVQLIATAVKSLVPEADYKKYSEPKLYEPLVASIHLLCYLLKEHFAYIVFLNDRIKTAICFQSKEDPASNLKAAFDFFAKNNFKFKFSVDPSRKSISVTFNG